MRVALDACVLFPTVMRAMLLGGGGGRRLRAGLVGAHPRGMGAGDAAAAGGGRGGGAGARSRGCAPAWPGAEVAVPEELVAGLSLPDPDDRHVLAAAIAGGAEALVTLNRADFPPRTLARHGILLRDPDGFLLELLGEGLDLARDRRGGAGAGQAGPQALRPMLKRAGLPRLGKALG